MKRQIVNYSSVIREAWKNFDASRSINSVEDISAKVSTNHVFRLKLSNGDTLIAKVSYFGKYEHFKEDHRIIHALANNLLYPYENLLAKSLLKNNQVYTYRFKSDVVDTWVVFYNPIRFRQRLPKRLDEKEIRKLGAEAARFHKACQGVRNVLPKSSKTLRTDVLELLDLLDTPNGQFEHRQNEGVLREQSELFLKSCNKLEISNFDVIPVFIDWNIGNFSVDKDLRFYSRWDYDWFRMSTRIMDFYFFSRVVSDVGDRTSFSYFIGPLMEDRFIIFLKEYHKIFPLTYNEVQFMKEAYRFFVLNYVIKYGRYFFHQTYATKLQKEAYELYFPSIERQFNASHILSELGIRKEEDRLQRVAL